MNALTYLAHLVADSRKWSAFGSDTFAFVSPAFFYANIDAQVRITGREHASLEKETRRVLFWRATHGLHSDPLPLHEVAPRLKAWQ